MPSVQIFFQIYTNVMDFNETWHIGRYNWAKKKAKKIFEKVLFWVEISSFENRLITTFRISEHQHIFRKSPISHPLSGLDCWKLLDIHLRPQGVQKTRPYGSNSASSYDKIGLKFNHTLFLCPTSKSYKKKGNKIWKTKSSRYVP